MLRTFSSTSTGARRPFRSRNTSPTRPEASPVMPFVRPACDRSVHGNPAVTTSTSGSRSSSRTSPASGTPGKRSARTACAGSHHSHSSSVTTAGFVEPEFDPADAGEQPGNAERPRRRHADQTTRLRFRPDARVGRCNQRILHRGDHAHRGVTEFRSGNRNSRVRAHR